VNSLTITRQTALVITALGYAAMMGIEGVALHQRKQWARWFTIIATSSLIPIEVYEIARELHPIGVFVLRAQHRHRDLLDAPKGSIRDDLRLSFASFTPDSGRA
jgi:Predicted membrane protein (DUF2127)